MKRILFYLFLTTVCVLLVACNHTDKSNKNSSEIIPAVQITTEAVFTNAKTFAVTTSTTTTTESATIHTHPVGEVPFAQEIDLEDMNFGREFIFFNKYGRYYGNEIGGRQSANHVLCLDRGDGECQNLYDTEDYQIVYHDENALYLWKYVNNAEMYVSDQIKFYKVEDTDVTQISPRDIPDKERSFSLDPLNPSVEYVKKIYYPDNDDDYYYQLEYCVQETVGTVYRIEGDNKKTITYISSPHTAEFYDSRLWYSGNEDLGNADKLFMYDLVRGERHEFDYGRIGSINNGYMYYANPDKQTLYRLDLSSYKEEKVLDGIDYLSIRYGQAICFFKDHIFYSKIEKQGNDVLEKYTVYRFGEDGDVPIFEVKDGYYVNNIQCHEDRLYLELGCGGFWLGIFEIDTDGNVMEIVHEDHEGWCTNHVPYFSDNL